MNEIVVKKVGGMTSFQTIHQYCLNILKAIRQMQMSAEQLDDLVAVMLEQTQKVCFNTSLRHSKKVQPAAKRLHWRHRAKVWQGVLKTLQDDPRLKEEDPAPPPASSSGSDSD